MNELEIFNQFRTTICQCKNCQTIYRLSDSRIWEGDVKPQLDLLDKLNQELIDLEVKEKVLREKLKKVKEEATLAGRIAADNHISQFDSLFQPLGLVANDAKVHFHPIDFLVFNGMNDTHNPKIKNIVLIDQKENKGQLQDSIRECVENEHYEFLTIKIQNDGTVTEEY